MRLGIQERPLSVVLFLLVSACAIVTALARPVSVFFDPSGRTAMTIGVADIAAMLLMATVPFAFRSLLPGGYLIVAGLGVFKLYGLTPAVGVWLALAATGMVAELAVLLLPARLLPGSAPLNLRNWLGVGAWLAVVFAVARLAIAADPSRPQIAWAIAGLAAAWALLWAAPWLRRLRIDCQIEICRPPDEVFATLSDHERGPTWMDNIRWVESLPALPGVERRYWRAEIQLNGTDAVTEVRVLESRPGEKIVSSVIYGRRAYTTTTFLTAVGCGTLMNVAMTPKLPWAGCVLGARLSGVAATSSERTAANLARLKQLLDAGG